MTSTGAGINRSKAAMLGVVAGEAWDSAGPGGALVRITSQPHTPAAQQLSNGSTT